MNDINQKQVLIVAGPNGAGKTTFARTFLAPLKENVRFINADYIAAGLSPFDPELAAIRAGKIMLEEVEDCFQRGESFSIETTLSGRSYLKHIKRWREAGYRVKLIYLSLNDVGISIRNDHPEYLSTPPEWMKGCERWDERKHRIGLIDPCDDIRCGCVTVGVTACICGDYVYPCTLSVGYSRGIQVDQYISGKDYHRDKIGVMRACLDCVNNTRATCKTMENT